MLTTECVWHFHLPLFITSRAGRLDAITATKCRRQSLHLVRPPGQEGGPALYVNVDVSNPPGIHRASSMGLAPSGLADVIVTPWFVPAASELFSEMPHRGRMFALFRHPVDRAVSKFYYLQSATWEPSYHEEWNDMTLVEYASHHAEHDWMVHVLAGKTKGPATEEDLEVAKEVLRRKCLVGMVDRMEESVDRFGAYFGWDLHLDDEDGGRGRAGRCVNEVLGGGMRTNHQEHPHAEEGSEEWEALMRANRMDVKLFEYAQGLFEEQGRMFNDDRDRDSSI